jgi:CBS domain containing-hemolysin-like protein
VAATVIHRHRYGKKVCTLIYFPALFGLAVLVALSIFFWKVVGPGSGRKFGNQIAAHLRLPRNVFYALLENGVKGSSRSLLLSLEKSSSNLDTAAVKLGPTLCRGLERLEKRFGPQEMYELAKPIVASLAPAVPEQQATPDNLGGDA